MSVEKNKNVIITKKAREKLVKARAGAIQLPKIAGMAFGNGGVEAVHGYLQSMVHCCIYGK